MKINFKIWDQYRKMSTSPENVNIYLGQSTEKDKVLADASPHERYIILMNETLQVDNRRLTETVTDLESQVEELESDNSSMEKSKTYMKGLLKNFIEMTKWYKEICTHHDDIRAGIIQDLKAFKYKATRHLRILEGIMMVFMAVWYEYNTISIFLPVMGAITFMLAFQESTLMNLKICPYKTDTNKISDLIKEISKAEAAQDYIHVLIDQQ